MSAILHIHHPDIQYQPKTTLTVYTASASTSLSVPNSNGFTTNKYVLIGGYKTSAAEIVLAGTVSSVSAIPVAATSFDHTAGETIRQIPYNKIEIDYSTDLATVWDSGLYENLYDAMSAASWTNLATVDITPSQEETTYKDDSTSSRSYRWRYKNTTDTIYSGYINIQLPTGYEEKQVATIIRKAINRLNKKVSNDDTGQVNIQFCLDELNYFIRWTDSKKNNWVHNQSFDNVISEITAGKNGYILPSNIAFRESKQSLWSIKIDDGSNLESMTKKEKDALHVDWHMSPLAAQLTSASSTATLDDTSNFPDEGTFDIWTSGTKDAVRYSANNRSTNVLTVVDASTDVAVTHSVDTQAWNGATFGTPTKFTVYDGKIWFDIVPDDSLHSHNIQGDYYLKPQVVTNEYDYLRIQDPNGAVDHLRYAIADKTNNNTRANEYKTDRDKAIVDLKRTSQTGQKHYLKTPKARFYKGRYIS